ncbi:MAG: hypothetical protein ACE5G2_08520 [Candidatus Krumholzibacteriia bacterium]
MSRRGRPAGQSRRTVTIQLDKRILLVLFTLGVLFVGFVGGNLSADSASLARQRQLVGSGCTYALPASQEYIVAGLQCPEPDCELPVAECHADASHRIQSMVKDLLLLGRSPDQIHDEITKRYGDRVKPQP